MDFLNTALVASALLGIATSLIATWIWNLLAPKLPVIVRRQAPSISGWWIGRLAPEYDPGREVLNLIRIRETEGKVKIYIEHYNNRQTEPAKYRGQGIYLAPSLSAIYYEAGFRSNQTGVWSLRYKRDASDVSILEGLYAHVIDREGVKEAAAKSEYYCLRPVVLPFLLQLKILLGRYGFKNYQAALVFTQKRVFEQKRTAGG